jgi:hypothetical protein
MVSCQNEVQSGSFNGKPQATVPYFAYGPLFNQTALN